MKNVAIYTRKSKLTNIGDSLGNQIELCKNHLKTIFFNEDFSFKIYEDEGFSGSNTNRPKFQELLKDAQNKDFSILICYRLDRISRNVADFSNILTLLQQNNIDFISIKEQFDTTSPMGRAMLYISSVFAQLERETIAERVRDNLLELSKTGRWLGGPAPFGFINKKDSSIDISLKKRQFSFLSPVPKELNVIKIIFSKYLELHSINGVFNYLNREEFSSYFHNSLSPMKISRLLKSPLYVESSIETHNYIQSFNARVFGSPNGNGYLTYNKKNSLVREHIYSISSHKGIISSSDWLKVQELLCLNSKNPTKRLGTSKYPALLSGLLKCSICGEPLIVKKTGNSKANYVYYLCKNKECHLPNARTSIIDSLIIDDLNLFDYLLFKECLNDAILKATPVEIAQNEVLGKDLNIINDICTSFSLNPPRGLTEANLLPFDIKLPMIQFRFILKTIIKDVTFDGSNLTLFI